MGALTSTANVTLAADQRYIEIYTLGAITHGDTLATPLAAIDGVFTQIKEAAASVSSSDALAVTDVTGGTVTFGVSGTVSGAYVQVIGV